MKVETTYAPGYTAYADYEDFTISYQKGEMPPHSTDQFDSVGEMEAKMTEYAPVAEWTEVEEE